jgi:hypothetical protein
MQHLAGNILLLQPQPEDSSAHMQNTGSQQQSMSQKKNV